MRKHRTHTLKRWEEVHEDYERSGLSASEFCRKRGVKYHTYIKWRGIFSKRNKGKKRQDLFREIKSIPPVRTASTYTVKLRSGHAVELPGGFSAPELKTLIEVLESC